MFGKCSINPVFNKERVGHLPVILLITENRLKMPRFCLLFKQFKKVHNSFSVSFSERKTKFNYFFWQVRLFFFQFKFTCELITFFLVCHQLQNLFPKACLRYLDCTSIGGGRILIFKIFINIIIFVFSNLIPSACLRLYFIIKITCGKTNTIGGSMQLYREPTVSLCLCNGRRCVSRPVLDGF